MRTCDHCGRRDDDPARTLTWVTTTESTGRCVYCDVCARENLRSIEAGLDREFW